MQRGFVVVVVFCAGMLVLGWDAGQAGMATTYVDPVSKIVAQDEAVYASTTFGMVASGDWITPRFLGRYALYKPPLEYWLAGLCVKVFGRTPFAVRLPSIVASAATVALVFAWLRQSLPIAPAVAGALLLLSSHLFFALSRTGLTDALLTLEMAVAMYALARDPALTRRGTVIAFGCALGAAIMTKALAGLFPVLVLACVWVFSKERATFRSLAQVTAIAATIALSWYAWQLYRHPRWFWSELFLTEVLAWGVQSPIQTTQESQPGFYLKRLFWLDPALLLIALFRSARFSVPLPASAGSPRRTEVRRGTLKRAPQVEFIWIAVVLACALAFQYRNASYLMPIFPAMALLAANAFPQRWALLVAAGLFIAKALAPAATWGISFAPESVNPTHAALDQYAARHRGNELIIIQPEDQFYSAGLNLPQVRYCYLDPQTKRPKYPLDFEYLGITVTAEQFAHLNELRPTFAQHLREWNLDSTEPIATVILARTEAEIDQLMKTHPEDDFYLPAARKFVLSSVVIQRP
jgi:4-amino-4-deoxy-L-arabinose transferase-like glycosyltransferase